MTWVMDLRPPAQKNGLAPNEHVHQRVDLNRALSDWRSARRLNRTGSASYRDVRDAKHAYLKSRRKLEQICSAASLGPFTVPAP